MERELLDPEKVRKAKEQEKDADRVKKQNLSDMKSLLKYPQFQRFAWRILSETGIFRTSFNLNNALTAFNEGRREIGLLLLQEINEADITAFEKMQQLFISDNKNKKNANEQKEREEQNA